MALSMMVLRCALLLAAAAQVAAQEALRGAAAGPAAVAVVETDAAPTHLPPNWQPPTTPAALEAFCLALLTPVILIGAMLAMGIVAGEQVKESHVTGAMMTSKSGDPVKTANIESESSIFDAAKLTPYQIGQVKFLSFYVDMTAATTPGASMDAWVEMTIKTASAYKSSSITITMYTPEGHEVKLNSDSQTGTIRMGSGVDIGKTFSIYDALPAGQGRKLLEAYDPPVLQTITPHRQRQLSTYHEIEDEEEIDESVPALLPY